MKLIYTGYKWREATEMELLLRGEAGVLKQMPAEPHAGDVYEAQSSLNSDYHPEPNFKTYTGWILTVGDLMEKLRIRNPEDRVRLSFRGLTPFGEVIDISLPIECIGNSFEYTETGERVNLIYINGHGD